MKPAPRTSKTKAMRDAPWRSLKPKSFAKVKKSPPATVSTPRSTKKRKVTSDRAQSTVAHLEDVPALRHAKRPRVRDTSDGHSDMSQSSGDKSLDSQDYESSPDEDDLRELNGNELARTFDDEAVQWARKPSQSSQYIRRNSEDRSSKDDSSSTLSDGSIITERRRILTKRAISRCAEDLEFSGSDDKDLDPDRPRFVGPHNANWPRAPFLPAGPGQRNICINTQPVPLTDILKHTIKSLIRDCAFEHGYIPVERQTECLLRILISSAEKLNQPYYTERVKTDPLIQRVICDMLNVRVSQYRTNVKRVASGHVIREYGLSDDKYKCERHVKDLLHKDQFIFLPKEEGIDPKKPFHHPAIIKTIQGFFFERKRGGSIAQKYHSLFTSSMDTGAAAHEVELPPAMVAMTAVAVQASLDEKISGLDFNADTYEDSYNTFISFLNEIRAQKPLAYHRLMADLYKYASTQNICPRNKAQNAMLLLDLDGMDV